MAKNGLKKRSDLFDLYSSNLTSLLKKKIIQVNPAIDYGASYVCPLCLRDFPKEYIHDRPEFENHLTLEDVPPKKNGGKPLILTCKECNNRAGGHLDHQIEKAFNARNALNADYRVTNNTRITINNEINIGASIIPKDENNLNVRVINKQTNKYDSQKWDELIKSGVKEFKIEFTIQGADKVKYPLALLRIAHLLSFQKFGYSYLFADGTRSVIDILKNDPVHSTYRGINFKSEYLNSTKDGLYAVVRPKELISLVVIFSLNIGKHVEKHAVILPHPFDSKLEIFDKVEKLDGKTVQGMQTVKIPEFDYLTSTKLLIGYQRVFLDLMKIFK